jgi:tetratricopeptide (TPR) repeat protein
MKKIFTIVAVILVGLTNGQECATQAEDDFGADVETSRKYISLYSSYLGQKNYQEAANFWWQAQSAAPNYKPNLYSNGVSMYQKLAGAAKKAKDTAQTIGYADTLFKVYDLWIETYGDCYKTQMKYANDRVKYFPKDFEVSFAKYKAAFAFYPLDKIRSSWVQKYFTTAYMMVRNKRIECDEILELYDFLTGICDKKSATDKNFITAQKTLDKYVAPCASCDKLEELFKPKFEASPDDIKLMEKIVGMMGGRKCTDSEFYMMVVEKIYAITPTYKSARGLALYYYNKKAFSQAANFFEEALTLTEDELEKAKLYPPLVNIYASTKNCTKRIKYAGMIGSNERNAAIASCIASKASSCGNTKVLRSFGYCLALDYAEKSGGKVSSAQVSAWKKSLPTSQELFFDGFEVGQSVPVPCWNGEKTKVRVQN